MTDIDYNGVPVLRVTDAALATVLEARASEAREESLALWVEINGSLGGAYTYDMYLQAPADARPEDWSDEQGGMALVVPSESIERMRGAVLDAHEDGMVIENPNQLRTVAGASPQMPGPPADLSGSVAQRVLQVLEQQINPSIAAHGGRADLVAVEDDAAYLRLSGGCAGCGMAAVTLSQGIEVALRESVPE